MSSHRGLVDDYQAHVASGALDLAHGAFYINRVHILYLDFCDFTDLGASHLADFIAVWLIGSFINTGGFTQQNCSRR
jgi:hypothetical protein